ncbi:hypothetical protein NST89_02320 [Caldifermentibacillus hisashii]|uniref:hypothetical protein n=1 Tax=Caldifermentibacillus hisashii TaxID=996558 RepID=UPI003135ADEC
MDAVSGCKCLCITPIVPGKPITPGTPIQGGTFIIPGKVYEPGKAVKGGDSVSGSSGLISGQPIVPSTPLTYGIFIIPNAPPVLGHPVLGGTAIQGGQGPNGGTAINGGQGPNGGTAINGGQGPNGGTAINGGQGPNGGTTISGGQGPNGGTAINGGQDPNGGAPTDGGQGLSGGNSGKNGNGPSNGNELIGESSQEPSLINLLFKSTDTSRGIVGQIAGVLKDYKTNILGFADKIAQASAAGYAGFMFNEKGNGKYGVKGKNKLNNKVVNWFYERYKGYKHNGEETTFGPYSRHIGKERLDSFFKSKRIGHVWESVKGSVKESWNIFSKDAYKAKSLLKLNGPVNVLLNSSNHLIDYSKWGRKSNKGYASTDFAADVTVDTAIGVGSTALGSLASSAIAGAVAGSTVPVVGTIVGAVAGLGTGFIVNYLINGTKTGRKIKTAVRDAVKVTYDGIVSGAKKLGKRIKSGVSSMFKKAGSLFGG